MKRVTHKDVTTLFAEMSDRKKFNSLEELYEAAGGSQVTVQGILNERVNLRGSWTDIAISTELENEVCKTVAQVLGGHYTTRAAVEKVLKFGNPQHSGLSRLVLAKYGDKVKIKHIAYQDGIAELRSIRTSLKRLH